MKYRYEHLENYPGNELATGSRSKQLSLQHKPSDRCGAAHNQHQRANSITYRDNQYQDRRSSLVSQEDHRPQTRGRNYVPRPNECVANCYCSGRPHVQPQVDRSKASQGRYAHAQDLQRQPRLKMAASRSSLAAATATTVRYGNKSGGRRCYHSKSSLMSNSPSTYRSIKPSQSYKRHISFKYHHSRNARGGKPRLTVRNDADKGIWVDAEYHQDLDREDSPKFEQPKAALRPRKRRESASIAKRRSTVVIDGLVLDGGYSGTVQSLKNKTSFIRENEDAERRRMVSKELEEVCEKAFNGCSLGSSLTTSSTVKSIGYTADESTNSHSIACSSPSIQIPSQSLYTNTLSSTENNLPFDTPIRKRSDDINTSRISRGEKNDPEKGCLDDVIEHLDRLMDSASKLRSIDQLRAVSHGGIPLGLGDSPAMMKQYLDQEERDHQRYLIARATLRNVSTPNPHRTPTVNRHGHQSKQPMSTNIALEPALLNVRPKSSLRSPVDETPRSETRNTIHAVNEALRFDAPMPTPELRLPVDQRGVQDDKSKAASGGNWNTKFVGTSEPVTIKAVHEPKKKRSFLDIFTGKKNVKTDKNKDKFEDGKNLKAPGTPGALGTPGAFGTFTHPSVDVLDTEKGTFGRRSGNALRRFVSRDAKMELGLANNASGESAGSNMALNSMLGELFIVWLFFRSCFTDLTSWNRRRKPSGFLLLPCRPPQ